jgi:hypothetical protein
LTILMASQKIQKTPFSVIPTKLLEDDF